MPRQIQEGEICSWEIAFTPTEDDVKEAETKRWLEIKEGVFTAPASPQGRVACRMTYEKRKRNMVFVTVDARPSLRRSADREDPNGFLNDEFQIVPAENVVNCTLSIDLGNTRTVALLVDRVGEATEDGGRLPIYPLPMRWTHLGRSDEQTGTFESVASLICPDSTATEFCGNESRTSFVKLGKFALANNRAFGKSLGDGRYTLSSPKRYFWDHEPVRRNWIGAQYLQHEADASFQTNIRKIDGRLVKRLATEAGCEPYRLPPASVLSAMVVEIYEQACHYVGSDVFKSLTRDNRCRRISKIHVTYPSTLLPRELDAYRLQLEKGLAAYRDGFCAEAIPVTLTSEIDEASAVLSVYTYSEMRRSCGALFWLQSIGRLSPLGAQARIAVIDVGGGTTDLSISAVEALREDAGVDPFKASIDLICRDGVNNAGDALMFEFIRTCVAKLGFDSLVTASRVGAEAVQGVVERYQSSENEMAVRGLTRNFWFDLALKVAAECDALLQRYPNGKIEEGDLHSLSYRLNETAARTWNLVFGNEKTFEETKEIKVRLTQETFKAYLDAVERTFRKAAKSFAAAIFAYDVDVLLFSGKTAEFRAVQDVFRRAVALPDSAIKSMKDYAVGGWCGYLTDTQGRISDSKISTALGGALYSLRTDSAVNMTFTDHVQGLACRWGIVSDGGPIAFTHAIFPEGHLETDIPMNGAHKLIARQMAFSHTAILCYELRFKPGVLEMHQGLNGSEAALVRLVCDPLCQALSIESCSGTYGDLTAIGKDDIECRICTMNGEFMMDKAIAIKI